MWSFLSRPNPIRATALRLGLVLPALWPARPASADTQVFFEQPSFSGIAGHLFVPKAVHHPPPVGSFELLLWQPNPATPDGMLVPTSWDAGQMTGFTPPGPLARYQLGFRDAPGASTAQAAGDTVGAYIDSQDLPAGSLQDKMMVTPEYRAPHGQDLQPFSRPGRAVRVMLDLQIPVARDGHIAGSVVHASADLSFQDMHTGIRVSYGCNLFFNGRGGHSPGHIAYDQPSGSVMANSRVDSDSPWLTLLPGSATRQTQPWRGWRHFDFAITQGNFTAALEQLRRQSPTASTDPADYRLTGFHLNAELHFGAAPAVMGWSMRRARVTVEDMP